MNRILVTMPSMPGYEEYCEEIRSLWDTRWITNMGSKHKELQEQLKNYLQVPNVDLTTKTLIEFVTSFCLVRKGHNII